MHPFVKSPGLAAMVCASILVSALLTAGQEAQACSLTVTVSGNPYAVYPRDTPGKTLADSQTTITVTVTQNGSPAPNKTVTMSASGIYSMGGHVHDSSRPAGTFNPSSGTTDGSGHFQTTYTASRFGGSERIKATVEGVSGTWDLNVRVPYLSALSDGQYYDLTGQTSSHPNNHYGTSSTNTALPNIASDFAALYPNDPDLDYNDMSLAKGGLFDIGPPYGSYWNTPHSEHRVGKNCDLSNILSIPSSHRPDLADVIGQNGGTYLDETNHWHLRF